MRIVNISDKPFEFMFDATSFGPFGPGQIVDLPDEIAMHGVKRSMIIDEEGITVGQKMDYVSSVDSATLKKIVTYDCPMVLSGQCKAKGFKSLDDLKAHMEQAHWGKPEEVDPLGPASPKQTILPNTKANGAKAQA